MDYESVPKRAMGERIRALRVARGWRQVDLARASGVGRSLIAMVETGRMGLGASSLFGVADALGVEARWLWRGEEDNHAGS